MTTAKFEGDTADRWSDEAYADPHAYLGHRADLVCALGPPLAPGERVLDLACGDGGLGEILLGRGLRYSGVDASSAMVAAARRRLAGAAEIVEADLDAYVPPAPVAATTVFRAVYYAHDRAAFFHHVARFTEKKLVFDLNPRRYSLGEVRAELKRAGFARLDLQPFFVPQQVALPEPARRLLLGAERVRPLASLLLLLRFSYVCAASRNER
jgi:SAM-dependent methyltransferase